MATDESPGSAAKCSHKTMLKGGERVYWCGREGTRHVVHETVLAMAGGGLAVLSWREDA